MLRSRGDVLDVAILAADGVTLLSLAAALDPLRGANRVAGREVIRWRVLTEDGAPLKTTGGLSLPSDGAAAAAGGGDALIVAASFGARRRTGPATLRALRAHGRRGGAAIGIESGAWALARAGLLDGRRATTHWEDLEAFADAHPAVDVAPDRYVIDGARATAGGAAPALDLMIELMRRAFGPGFAADLSGLFVHDAARSGADPQAQIPMGPLGAKAPRVAAAVRLMAERLDAPPPMAEIAALVGVSPRTLDAAFRRALGATPGAYCLSLRLAEARRIALETDASSADIAAATGFASASAFARAFRRRYGVAPREARRAAP